MDPWKPKYKWLVDLIDNIKYAALLVAEFVGMIYIFVIGL